MTTVELINAVESSADKASQLAREFQQSPTVQTAVRICDTMQAGFAAGLELQNRALGIRNPNETTGTTR